MRLSNEGAFYTISVSEIEVYNWNRRWPCSSLKGRQTFTFDKRNGDLVDRTGQGDGDEALALCQDAQNYYGIEKLQKVKESAMGLLKWKGFVAETPRGHYWIDNDNRWLYFRPNGKIRSTPLSRMRTILQLKAKAEAHNAEQALIHPANNIEAELLARTLIQNETAETIPDEFAIRNKSTARRIRKALFRLGRPDLASLPRNT